MKGKRIISVDIFRGMTVLAMILVNNPGSWGAVYPPLLHAEWHGLTPTDFIFPFFLFIVGVGISIAYEGKTLTKKNFKKLSIRSLKIILLGLSINFLVAKSWATLRFLGVLQRIGLVFFISTLLYLKLKPKQLIYLTVFLLIGYWLWLVYLPLPNGHTPNLEKTTDNWTIYIDQFIIGKNHLWTGLYDPEGLASTISSIASVLMGILFGRELKKGIHFLKWFFIGAGFVGIGYLWAMAFPFNKALWSSSFVLVTSGVAIMINGFIERVAEKRCFRWLSCFKPMGMNALIMYFGASLLSIAFDILTIKNNSVHHWLYQELLVPNIQNAKVSSLCYAFIFVFIFQMMAYYFYKKKWFIKV